jgi:hypothetical protein
MTTKQEIHEFLIELRDSGETNMFGAGAYLEHEFGMTRYEAKAALLDWMQSFREPTQCE